jgi:SAM-dependent methyltransferase
MDKEHSRTVNDENSTQPHDEVTEDFHIRRRENLETMRGDLAGATSAVTYSWIVKTLITKNLAGDPKMVLDVGCAWGRETIQFRNAVGVDLCLPYLKTARNYTKHDYVFADANHLPFRSAVFDFICSSEVIEHLTNAQEAISEIVRTLTEGGRLVIQTPNRHITLGKIIHKGYGHVREFSKKELVRILLHRNLRIRLVTGSTIPYVPTKNRLYRLNFNSAFFSLWKILNRFLPLKWDIIICAEKNGSPLLIDKKNVFDRSI